MIYPHLLTRPSGMQGIDALPGPLDAILYVNEPLQGALLDIGGRIQLVLLLPFQGVDLLINTMR
jgi:hypothetical protein